MAHEIETSGDGRAAFVSARQDPWHALGTTLPDVFSAEDAMRVAHLGNWNVHKVPLQALDVDDNGVAIVDVPDRFATVRTHPFTGQLDYLGVVRSTYEPIQNEACAELLNLITDSSGAVFDTAGSLFGGRQMFITMRMPKGIRIGGVDPLDVYLAALNSHDGSRNLTLLVTPVRIVCGNTQAAALRSNLSKVQIRHTRNYETKVQVARETLGLTWKYLDAFETEAEKMINASLSESGFRKVIRDVWTPPSEPSKWQETYNQRRESELLRLFLDAHTNASIRGTRWGGYQAFVEWVDHEAPVKAQGDKRIARAQRVASGAMDPLKERAFDLLRVAG